MQHVENEEHHIPTIKRPSFDFDRFQKPTSRARNAKEALIEDIVEKCQCRSEAEKRELAKRIAIWMNTTGADETDLHALLKKAQDRSIRSFGGFVNWTVKITKARQ